ncbi:3-keto-disaccharide hydrolase [Catenovulum adriaticum]|uniref:DUF1080 domain-containing protein n=1 Tax=Catenovulum adriaticum TaxID=2984846 RepID=A0ABY7AQK2_9ALTE|nr:DUF1080 domain-containing protein [Catenovulum sp. TS8]WAJ71825.1 DUF1080 domain-containing protein [Catenovulum sp. TS8]
MKERKIILITAAVVGLMGQATAAGEKEKTKPLKPHQYSEFWQPKVPVVEALKAGQPPSDAIVLFDGSDLSAWQSSKGGQAQWTVNTDGSMTVKPRSGAIETKQKYCDVQLHIEWKSPPKAVGKSGQQLGNSGIFMQGLYEMQILDSYQNETYSNGQAASIYKQHIPLANATRPTGQWNEYDIIYTAPRFNKKGQVTSPARFTAMHNGILVLHNVELQGPTVYVGTAHYDKAHGCEPIKLQDHRDPVSFRNIWLREL